VAGFVWLIVVTLLLISIIITTRFIELDSRLVARLVIGALTVVWVISLVATSVVSVPTKNVGIKVAFGKPQGALDNGIHVVWPWVEVTDWDATVKTIKHEGDWGKGCTVVRLASQSTACVENRIRWRILESAAPNLFKSYREQDHLEDALVETELRNALNSVFARFDPTATLAHAATDKTISLQPYDPVATQNAVMAEMRTAIGADVVIDSVNVPIVHYDGPTEDRIKAYQQAVANYRIAEQNNLTADITKSTADKLNPVLTLPFVINECLEVVRDAMKAGFQLPANFCNFASAGAVVAPANVR